MLDSSGKFKLHQCVAEIAGPAGHDGDRRRDPLPVQSQEPGLSLIHRLPHGGDPLPVLVDRLCKPRRRRMLLEIAIDLTAEIANPIAMPLKREEIPALRPAEFRRRARLHCQRTQPGVEVRVECCLVR